MRVRLILEVYCFSSIRFWWHSCGCNQTGRTIQEELCIFLSACIQTDKSESWYATNPSVSYCETGEWTCSPCVSTSKTEQYICWCLVYKAQHATPYRNIALQVPVGKPKQKQSRALLLYCNHIQLFFPLRYTFVTFDLLFCFKALSFYGFQGLSLKSVF